MSKFIYGLAAMAFAGLCYCLLALNANSAPTAPGGMVWIPAGEFQMGSVDGPRTEQPVHRVFVDGFFLDEHEVTNEQFDQFVTETKFVTEAEKKPDWEVMKKSLPPDTAKPPADQLVPGSLVFKQPKEATPAENVSKWWAWTPGAYWRQPEGPGSDLKGREKHPVVHVAFDDVQAYCKWAKKRLPTEAEWEYAARGGLAAQRFTWGNTKPTDRDGQFANIWQGTFPHENTLVDGHLRTAPVKSYTPNGYKLYDMAGNVWEWCSDWYRADAYETRVGLTKNPTGPNDFWDPREPETPKRVIRGGSFLCHVTYCESYRPAARRGGATDTGMSHTGFRCAKSVEK
ncbi:MAG: formylglycine-generating enzyme family protein [Fimbriiglobus sp.]